MADTAPKASTTHNRQQIQERIHTGHAGLASAGSAVLDLNDLYRLLVESVSDYAIFALDPTGHIMSWNPGAERIKGYTASEIIGKHFSIFYPESDIQQGKPKWELEVAAAEGRFEDEGWRLRKDGTRFWANVIISAVRDSSGTLVGFGKVTRDLTERMAAQERAMADRLRVAEAEASNRTKTEFLAVMSHELRTPLNAIGGYAEILAMGLRGPVTEEQKADLQRIRKSQQHLLGIINDILNYSRVGAGKLSYAIAPVPLIEVVDAVLPLVGPQASAKNLTVERGPCDDQSVAAADRAKVEQILLNLLSNAVKYTPAGGRVTVGCAARNGFATIDVTDTGPGIPPEQRAAIFEPFVQLDRSMSTPHQGVGLGLAISRDLAIGMGGNLEVSGAPGGGAIFTLTLPRLS
jgi:PAS domain S-box-containing protein